MRRAAFVTLVLSIGLTSGVFAQTPPTQQPQTEPKKAEPRELMVAPDSAEKIPEAVLGNPSHSVESKGRPANICTELVAYIEEKAAAPKADAKAPEAGGKTVKPTTGTAGPGQTSPPGDRAQQKSGLSAPIPQDDQTSDPAQLTPDQAQALAKSNDLRGCQSAVRKMRRGGASVPSGLLALAALKEDLLAKSAPPAAEQPAPGARQPQSGIQGGAAQPGPQPQQQAAPGAGPGQQPAPAPQQASPAAQPNAASGSPQAPATGQPVAPAAPAQPPQAAPGPKQEGPAAGQAPAGQTSPGAPQTPGAQ